MYCGLRGKNTYLQRMMIPSVLLNNTCISIKMLVE